jgi:hydrogenase maturation factor
MNLHYAHLIEVVPGEGMQDMRWGRVRVGGAIKRVSLGLLPDAKSGDQVLLCDGVAISRVDETINGEKSHVSRNSR